MNNPKLKAYLAYASICIVWGTTYLAIRVGVEDLPPWLFAGFRWAAAGTFFLTVLKFRGYKFPPKQELLPIMIVGVLLLGVANGLVVVAEQWLPSGLTALLITTIPLIITVIELIFTRGKSYNIFIMLGLLAGSFGIYLILGGSLEDIVEGDYIYGIISIFFGVTAWSLGSVYSKYKRLVTHPLMSAAIQMLTAGVIQTGIGFALGEWERFYFTPESLGAYLYLLFIGSLFGYAAYIYAISELPVSFVATYAYVNPVIALFIGWLFLDEILTLNLITAALVILFGVYLVNRGNKQAKIKIIKNST